VGSPADDQAVGILAGVPTAPRFSSCTCRAGFEKTPPSFGGLGFRGIILSRGGNATMLEGMTRHIEKRRRSRIGPDQRTKKTARRCGRAATAWGRRTPAGARRKAFRAGLFRISLPPPQRRPRPPTSAQTRISCLPLFRRSGCRSDAGGENWRACDNTSIRHRRLPAMIGRPRGRNHCQARSPGPCPVVRPGMVSSGWSFCRAARGPRRLVVGRSSDLA